MEGTEVTSQSSDKKYSNMFKKRSTGLWTIWAQTAASCLRVQINLIMAISAMLLMCVTSSQTYSIDYFDCSQPTTIECFSRPSVCA
ncbi:MAG: hypothetical protein GY696_13750 [Gammaproteobacteria bacterium]|nr:hypothetical protein [Gammaproteobacteria bacterium]